MASPKLGRDSATVMISHHVREDPEDDYRRWQEKTSKIASSFDGFQGKEGYPPDPDGEPVWVVVFRFSTPGQLNVWLNSKERQESLLGEGFPLVEAPPTQQVLVGGKPPQDVVTAVISHRVKPGRERDYPRWQDKAVKAQQKAPSYLGSELFKPVLGLQEDWVVVFRFDTREHLDRWLESDTRKSLVKDARNYFTSYDVRKVNSSFGSWFQFDGGAAPPALHRCRSH
jgi:uncharacterized protein